MNKSLNKRVVIFSMITTICFIVLILVATYLVFRIQIMKSLEEMLQALNNRTLVQEVLSNSNMNAFFYESNSITETRILQSFWKQYNIFFLILIFAGCFFVLLQSFGIKYVFENTLRTISTVVRDKQYEQTADIPTEIQPLFMELVHNREEVERVTKQNEQFRSFASHELRNQITEILSLCYQLEIHDEQLLSLISEMQHTVANLLMLSYVPKKITFETVDVLLTVANVVDELRSSDYIKIQYDDEIVGAMIDATENLLYRCIFNILDNALKYKTDSSSVQVFVKQLEVQTITVCVENSSGDADFSKIKGHGIGLQLVEHITSLLNGYLYIENILEEHIVRVTVTFPLSSISNIESLS